MAVPGGREKYYKALFERLQARVAGFASITRCRPPSGVPLGEQPALVLHVADQAIEHSPRMPTKYLLGAILEVLVPVATGTTQTGDEILNDLLDAIEEALVLQDDEQPPANGESYYTTLGGICNRCWVVDSFVLVSSGEASEQAIALVPVGIEVCGSKRK